ncbi:uncharacterized protein Z520_03891 [Fonsecaea multimorphosa CBS 102226]|uniref:CorA-like transporter domain-containing protein n=1 Tax=Fonsecaea multimorphosa CBS 102226 TaxID=1442371 RepID=A0A0D2HE90_9EURO|nr:uncharacterized protein Z520_03891 [Fonsecaea multimorphosa CBS 102226]KIY00206.1 hypothetical protein Z520_03891 [Fonsecaea multimorphosa CBS 102226]
MVSSSLCRVSWDDHGYFQTVKRKLFLPNVVDALALSVSLDQPTKTPRLSKKRIRNISDLSEYIHDANAVKRQRTFLIISQEYSWGRLRFTPEAFQKLMCSLEIFSPFLDVVCAFGVKSSDDERLIHGFRSDALWEGCLNRPHEICYNILYMEKHDRELRDPWSLRQMGVYHQLGTPVRDPRWIILNATRDVLSRLELLLQAGSHQCQMALHCEFLSMLSSNWILYLEYLNSEWRKYEQDDKSRYATVDAKEEGYSISSLDVQELHALEIKVHRAEMAIRSCLDISNSSQTYFRSFSQLDGPELSCVECHSVLETVAATMARHIHELGSLDRRLRSTRDLLLQILAFRNEDLLQTFNRASCATLEALFEITNQGRYQQETLTRLLGQGQADSAMLKALSVVSTVCLPASLVASVFSSNLIQTTSQRHQDQSASGLVPSPQFWLYFAIALPLMGVTFAWITYLDHKARRKGQIT